MPVNRGVGVEKLMEACRRYFETTGRRVSYEYAMIDGVNDTDWQADLLARRLKGQAPADFPRETAIGALALYVSNESVADFQPMNINFGIMPPLDHRVKGKRNKNAELSQRSLALIEGLNERL